MNIVDKDVNMFVIPTHRECKKSVISVIEEMNYIGNDEKKVLMVIDNSNKEIYEQNNCFIKKISGELNFPVYHVGLDKMNDIIGKIAEGISADKEHLKELLLPDTIDYAKIYNMIYIIAAVMGAKKFHRRDSDCYYDESINKLKFAVESEELYLGIPVNQVMDKIDIVEKYNYKDDEKICIVGSDYIGNWNLDLEELMDSSDQVARRLLEICGIPEDGINQQLQDIYTDHIDVERKNPVLKNTFKVAKVPECGNMSMTEIYRYLPNVLGKNGMGFDYFTYFIAFLYKVPIVFHYNPILHVHDSKRYVDIDIINYWIGILKMVDLDIIYTEIIKSGLISQIVVNESGLSRLKETIATDFVNGLEKIIDRIDTTERVEKYNDVINDILIASGIPKYVQIGEKLSLMKDEIIDELKYEYKNSIELIREWRKIIECAQKLEIEF